MSAEREIIAQAIYEAPGFSNPWAELSDERKEPWLEDADRALSRLVKSGFKLARKISRKTNPLCRHGLPDCAGCDSYGCGG